MALHINKIDGVYTIKGTITASQVHHLRAFFSFRLEREENIGIHLGRVDQLDLSGAMMFKDLQQMAALNDNRCELIFGDNQKIWGAFRMLNYNPTLLAA